MATSLLPSNIRYKVNDPTSLALYKAGETQKIGGSVYLNPGVTAKGGVTDLTKLNTIKTPKPSDVLSVDVLGNQDLNLNNILGANTPSNLNVNSDLAGLLSLYGKQSKESQDVDVLQTQLADTMKQLGMQGADLQAELTAKGVPEMYKQVQELNLKAAQLQGSLGQFDAETEKLRADIENQAIPTGLLAGQAEQLQKQRDLTRLTKTAELSSTIALSQAYQGNAQLASDLAKNAVDMKYQPILANISVLEKQLDFASEKASKADQTRFAVIGELISMKKQQIADEKELENQVSQIAIEAATNGAPTHIVESIKRSTDPVAAARAASQYLTVNVQRKQELADQDKAFQRQKEMEAIQHKNRLGEIYAQKSGTETGFTTAQIVANPILGFLQIGGRRVQKADGGFDFYAPSGEKITAEQAANLTGIGTKADFLKGSANTADAQALSAGKPTTATQETTGLYAARIKQANDIFDKLESYTNNLSPAKYYAQAYSPTFLNFLKGTNFKSLDQAQRNFVNAVLRRESGAVISPAEFENAKQQYFPQPGDGKEVLAQKKANRKLVEDRFIQSSGSAYYGPANPATQQTTTTPDGKTWIILPDGSYEEQ